jgi:hypothetical protein
MGAPAEKGHMDIPPPGVGMSHLAKKVGWKEKLMDSDYLAYRKTY